jgi:hypothetical protein
MGGLVCIFLALSLFAPALAWAAPPEGDDLAAQTEAPAAEEDTSEQTLRAALEAYERGDLDLANTLLEQVHIARPSARTLRGLGIVAFQQRRFIDARVLLEQSLIHPVKPLDAELRANAQQLIALARTHLGELILRVTPDDAQLFVDGRATVYASGTPLTVAVGAHELSLRREGYEPKSMSIAIAAAGELSLDVTLSKAVPAPASAPVAPAANAQSDEARKPADERSSRRSPPFSARRSRALLWSGYAASVLSVVALGGAVAAAAMADHRIGQIESACRKLPGGQCSVADVERREDEKNLSRLERIATSGLIVSGASAVAGTTLLVLAYRSPTRHASALLLGVHVRF